MYNNILQNQIVQFAHQIGIDFIGFSKVEFLTNEAKRLEKWLKENQHGSMKWMENYFDKRTNPALLVDDAKTVISVGINYFPESQQNCKSPKISKYAYGRDYHFVLKEKLFALADFIRKNTGKINFRAFVDSAPIMDKVWANRAGIGWQGKHTNIINKHAGSYFFLGELVLDVAFEYNTKATDHCGTCTRCIDACPTQAIEKPYQLNAQKCISYLTIELRDLIPDEFKTKMDNWMFGCDICQDVCPWNSKAKPTTEVQFKPIDQILNFTFDDWEEVTADIFNKFAKESPLKRTKLSGIKRNLKFLRDSAS